MIIVIFRDPYADWYVDKADVSHDIMVRDSKWEWLQLGQNT